MIRHLPNKNTLQPTLATSYCSELFATLAEPEEELLSGGNSSVGNAGDIKINTGNITLSTSTTEILVASKFYQEELE